MRNARIIVLLLLCCPLFVAQCGGELGSEPLVDRCFGWGERFTDGDIVLTVFHDEVGTVTAIGERLGSADPWETITFGGNLVEIGRAQGIIRVTRQYEDETYRFGEDDDVSFNLPNDRSCAERNTLNFEITYSWGSEFRGPEYYELARE